MPIQTQDRNIFFVLNDCARGWTGHYGQKADMAGHDNWHVGNLYAYTALCYCDLGGGEVNNASHRDHHENNTCIQATDLGEQMLIRQLSLLV